MKKAIKWFLAAQVTLMVQSASSQYWEDAGLPRYTPSPTVCFTDTLHDQLIVAGQSPLFLDSLHAYMPLFRYDGSHWDTLGLFGNKILSAVVYNDTLIVAGAFNTVHDAPIADIACYVNGEWLPYGVFDCGINAAHINRLRILDGELYALGAFCNADGQLCNGVAKRVGGQWMPVPGWPSLNFMGTPWVTDIIRFQGRLIVCGNFNSPDFSQKDILQYDGINWVPVCDGCLSGGMDGAYQLIIYKDQLYMAGRYFYSGGNAGQGIMRWDGEQWYGLGPVGGGLQTINYSDQYSPSVLKMQERAGLLFLAGEFSFANHMTASGIVTWDGTDFCTLEGGAFTDWCTGMDFYHDTLYVGTSPFAQVGQGLVRYLGEYQVECSTLAVPEADGVEAGFQVAWDPSGEITLLGLGDGHHQLRIMDPLGRLVLEQKVRSQGGRSEVVRFADRSMAVYLLNVDDQMTTRLVPTR
ncbi:MAG: hypothetical protein KF843_11870 [Flavobacteriales bacterium]|nr:hypothetical protein [Flavobacteriales bacterium]